MMQGISVVVCSHNGGKLITDTLQHLQNQQMTIPLDWEVLLVDNASTDDLVAAAQGCWTSKVRLRVITEPRLGVANARMTGLQAAAFSYIVFVDDDNHLAQNYVQSAFEAMQQHPEAGAIGGFNEAVFESTPPAWFTSYQANFAVGPQASADGEIQEEHLALWTAGMVLRKAAWDELHQFGFKPLLISRKGDQLLSGEDTEICYMLRLLGWKLYYFSNLKLQHVMPAGRLTWQYLCRLKRALGATSLRLGMVRSLYHTAVSGESPPRKSWLQLLFADAWQILRQPAVLAAAGLGLFEGNHRILQMHALLGRFFERLRLMRKLDTLDRELWQRYAPLLDRKSARKNQ